MKFVRDDSTNYYRNNKTRQRLHRYVWSFFYGEIPNNYHIHHKDGNKLNNNLVNLELLPKQKHLSRHSEKRAEEDKLWLKNFYKAGVEIAKEWHKSEEGHSWHKNHYEKMKDKLHVKIEIECLNCGEKTELINKGKFCSNKCKSSYRRKKGIDNEIRECIECGNEFETNKYNKNITCSRSCGNKLRAKTIKQNKKALGL